MNVFVLIHDLSKRSTQTPNMGTSGHHRFNSRPLEEVDPTHLFRFYYKSLFQFTTSRRGRPAGRVITRLPPVFQFTTSRRGRPSDAVPFQLSYVFQFTTSRRGRPFRSFSVSCISSCFNSRPLEEVDPSPFPLCENFKCVSIHDLSKRSTRYDMGGLRNLKVSIHDLSKRSTELKAFCLQYDEKFQFTTSRRGRPATFPVVNMDLLEFQFTTSRRGRPKSAQAGK